MLFDGWEGLVRVLVVGTCAYAALVALLRVSGKRSLSKLNAFDLVVTVALGSTLATVLLSSSYCRPTSSASAATPSASATAVAWSSVRSARFRRAVRSEPTLLAYRGKLLQDALARERVTEEEVDQALRQHGRSTMERVGAVVLESDGSLAVLEDPPPAGAPSASSDAQ